MHFVFVVELQGTANYIKILSSAQQCFYGKFIVSNSPSHLSILVECLMSHWRKIMSVCYGLLLT